jgi:hypothetical protein
MSGDNDADDELMRVRLGEHLLSLYLQGRIDLDDDDRLVKRYYTGTTANARQTFASELAMRVSDGDLGPDTVERIERLWEWRAESASQPPAANSSAASRDELLALAGPLVCNHQFPRDWV